MIEIIYGLFGDTMDQFVRWVDGIETWRTTTQGFAITEIPLAKTTTGMIRQCT
jgi:hypothetical protein